jgi:signal transduction histidine kinase
VKTIERLRQFSRQSPDTSEIETIEVNTAILEATEICQTRIRSGVHLKMSSCEPVAIRARSSDLLSSVINLVINANDAMTEGGEITITTRSSDSVVTIEVLDTGPGMSPEVKERLFEPFFTTKGIEGTGLGLAMVYAFVERHHGKIEVESELGQGARFRMSFPKAALASPSSRNY